VSFPKISTASAITFASSLAFILSGSDPRRHVVFPGVPRAHAADVKRRAAFTGDSRAASLGTPLAQRALERSSGGTRASVAETPTCLPK
jgi:hypothetical protein